MPRKALDPNYWVWVEYIIGFREELDEVRASLLAQGITGTEPRFNAADRRIVVYRETLTRAGNLNYNTYRQPRLRGAVLRRFRNRRPLT